MHRTTQMNAGRSRRLNVTYVKRKTGTMDDDEDVPDEEEDDEMQQVDDNEGPAFLRGLEKKSEGVRQEDKKEKV